MRNLKAISTEQTKLPQRLPLGTTAWDATNNSILCAFGPTPTQPLIELKRKIPGSSEIVPITSWDAPCPLPDLPCDEILLLHHFADVGTFCLILAGGDIVVVREDASPDQERIEIVGSVDAGISAAAWAPDEELLVIVTRADTLLLMSRDFEPVTEATLGADDLKASKHVSVGWGKKETQFQGKHARAMRDPTMPETIDEGQPSPHDDGRVSVSWRGDGAYFAINSIVRDHRRVIRVFDREAVLDSASEPVDGLESALSWRPAGNLLAGIKRSAQMVEVVFFERNGLRHGQFPLQISTDDMGKWATQISLIWNIDSSVLAVVFLDRIQLWTMGNYHYYLKQEIILQPSYGQKTVPIFGWHPETPLRLSLANHGLLLDKSYLHTTSRGCTVPPTDYGIVAVVDGKILKLTPLRHRGVPPPMSFCEVRFAFNIVDCAVSRSGGRIAVLTTNTLELCAWELEPCASGKSTDDDPAASLRHTPKVTKRSIALPVSGDEEYSGIFHTQVGFQGDDDVFVLAPSQGAWSSNLKRISWSESGPRAAFTECKVRPATQNLVQDNCQGTIWSFDGSVTSQVASEAEAPVNTSSEVELSCSQPDSALFQVKPGSEAQENGYYQPAYYRVSLGPNGVLDVDDTVLARDCTSFVLADAHLLFTTSQHLLKFVHLTHPSQMEVPGNTPELDERCRSVERGAKIVTAIPSIYAVVLQMPRGNLETIYPRVLVLSGIRRHIQSLDYRTAFLACQSHQVDMNILHDYQPEIFASNVQQFIGKLKKPSRIDEFLSKLKDEDVSQTLYRDTLANATGGEASRHPNGPLPEGVSPQSSGKVNRICDAFLSTLSPKSPAQLQNIITAHVSKRPPDLAAALTLVSSLRESSAEEADVAISHLCFLTDTNGLYDVSLALYDLELTLLVAQNAQRDPREYMPFLQSLQELSVLRRKYTIDNHLRNYSKALSSLHLLGAHDEVEAYMVKHVLYDQALELYQYDATRLSTTTRLYAQYLSTQSKHAAAATLFESLGDHTSAYPLYATAHQWRESLTCAMLIPLEPTQLKSLATSLATTCADEAHDYRSAAIIHAEYLSDIPTAARLLCKGSYFAESTRLLSLHSSSAAVSDEIPQIIDAGLTEKFGEIIELVADCKSQLSAQLPRIHELRRKKDEDPLAFYGGDPSANDGIDIPENISLAPTDASTAAGHSLFTRYGSSNGTKFGGGGTVNSSSSHKTSKTKRREERKRARGKKGSVYEEEYLVASVGRLIQRVNGVHGEVGRLVSALLRRGMRERARLVEETMREMVGLCVRARREVWVLEEPDSVVGVGDGEGKDGGLNRNGDGRVGGQQQRGRPKGGEGVLWDSQREMEMAVGVGEGAGQTKKEAPTVTEWVGSVLMNMAK